MKTFLLSLITMIYASSSFANAHGGPERIYNPPPSSLLKPQMLRNLDFIKNTFESTYAPSVWKKKHFNWDLDVEIENAKKCVQGKKTITLDEYHEILKKFFKSTRDYHVNIRFTSTESATLPFTVKQSNNRYFFSYINREKLPLYAFPFEVGDELVSFGKQSTHDAVLEIKKNLLHNSGVLTGDGNDKTDHALATEIFLTNRRNKSLPIPKGPIELKIRPKFSNHVESWQIAWEYRTEQIQNPARTSLRYSRSLRNVTKKPSRSPSPILAQQIHHLLSKEMITAYWQASMRNEKSLKFNPHEFGGKKSFVPSLGKRVWESHPESPFDAYLFQTPAKDLIGYIRIPNYYPEDPDYNVLCFAEIINWMESTSDALVIDQLNNPGGYALYLYALASMLTDKALDTPKHQMAITQRDVLSAIEALPFLENIENNDEAIEVLGPTFCGYVINYEFVQLCIHYFQFIINEWNAGRTLTQPYHLYGVDKIHPSPLAQYTKPILTLVNELDMSGGDFFPSILQDNNRAKILGERTAGAGGYISRVQYLNHLGIDFFTLTTSLAERTNKNPIENLGVTPDIQYNFTQMDLQFDYVEYVQKILETLKTLHH